MAKYRRPRRKFRKRRAGRLRKPSRKRSRMVKYTGSGLTQSCPLPKSFKFKTKYVSTGVVSLNPGAGTAATYVFSMNNLYDPNVTGSGHQVLGFDQLMPLYDHYTVIASRARLTLANTNTATPVQVIASVRDNNTTTNDNTQIIENGLNRYCTLGGTNGSGAIKTLQINCSPSKFFGQSVMKDDKYQGTITSAPDDQVYLHVTAMAMDGSTDPSSNVLVTAEIEYIAILTEPKLLTRS